MATGQHAKYGQSRDPTCSAAGSGRSRYTACVTEPYTAPTCTPQPSGRPATEETVGQ